VLAFKHSGDMGYGRFLFGIFARMEHGRGLRNRARMRCAEGGPKAATERQAGGHGGEKAWLGGGPRVGDERDAADRGGAAVA